VQRQHRILESQAAGAFTLLGGCSAPARRRSTLRRQTAVGSPTRGTARERSLPPSPLAEELTRFAHAQRILPRVAWRTTASPRCRNVAAV